MRCHLIRLAADEQGATATEYALVASLVSIAVIGALGAIGTALRDRVEIVLQVIAEAGAGGR